MPAWVRAARRGDEKGTKTVRHARVETDLRINSSKNRRGETISQQGRPRASFAGIAALNL